MRMKHAPSMGLPGLYLRQLQAADLADWYAYLSQPKVYQHTSWNLSSMADLQPLLDSYQSPLPDAPMRLALIDTNQERMIGSIGFHTISSHNQSAEIAYDLAPAYWGRGIASAICDTVCTWAFQEYGFVRIQATVLESNLASARVIEKSGFRYEGLLRAFRNVRGARGNFKMYARLSDD